MAEARYGTLGIIGKFQPPHKGHERLFAAALRHADRVRIGIGSTNRYDAERPFHPNEVEEMVHRLLRPTSASYDIVRIPDYGAVPGNEHGELWVAHATRELGSLDALVTGNPYVTALLQDTYRIIAPEEILDETARLPLCGSLVRSAIGLGFGWEDYVPTTVALYLKNLGIAQRVEREFGAVLRAQFPKREETLEGERQRVRGA